MNKYNVTDKLINSRNRKYINCELDSNSTGKFKVLGVNKRELNKHGNWVYTYVCEFNDGYQILATISNIIKGKVYNPYYPTHWGVGYLGELNLGSNKNPYYIKWKSMLGRCYSNREKNSLAYKDTFVSKRWLNFSNYIKDIPNIAGYDNYMKYKNKYNFHLDKDVLGDGTLYSKETCCFIPETANSILTKMPKNNTSGVKGVSWIKNKNRWLIQCGHKGECFSKYYKSLDEAKKKYIEAINIHLEDYLSNDFHWLDDKIKEGCRKTLKRINT